MKSTAGETLSAAAVGERGLLQDGEWAVYTAETAGIASGKTTRRFRELEGLMSWRSTLPAADAFGGELPALRSPEGSSTGSTNRRRRRPSVERSASR